MYPTIKRNLMASATLTELIKDNIIKFLNEYLFDKTYPR